MELAAKGLLTRGRAGGGGTRVGIRCGACLVGCLRALKLVLVTRGSAGALDAFATLSTAANSEENKEATTKIGISSVVSMRGSVGLCGYMLDLAAKGTYYLNCKTG